MLIRKCALVITALFIYFTLLPTIDASAAPNLQVKVTTGFNGKAKYGEGLPITITVENTGEAFSGDIVLDIAESYNLGNAHAIPFEIGSGETKSIQVAVAGLSDDYNYQQPNAQMIHFFEGGWEKENSIGYKGTKTLKASFLDPTTIFYFTLTNSADRLKMLNQVKQPNSLNDEIIHVAQLSNFTLPSDAVAWQMADYMLIDEFVLADLEIAQQQALIDYVRAGGVIVVGASDDTEAELGQLGDYLPLSLQSGTLSISSEKMKAFTNNNVLSNNLPVYDATLNEGATELFSSAGVILAAKNQLGSGAIIQTTFSLGDEPLAKDPVYSDLMTSILQSVKVQTSTNSMYGPNYKDQLVYELGSTNSLFSSFKVSTPLMIGIVVVYMILVGPLLYLILKRKDKREFAWGIIPLIAIIASAAIFGYGAKDRIARPQVQLSSFLYVNDDKSLNGYYAQSLLSNKSGDFSFEAPVSTTMVAARNTNSFMGQSVNVHEDAIFEKHATNSELTFRDVGYWSVSSMYGESHLQDVGNFDVNLRVEASKLIGSIQNNFPFSLKDVSVWSGSKIMKLGDLQSGEKIEVNKELGTVMLLPSQNPYINTNFGINPTAQIDLEEQRKQATYITSSQMIGQKDNGPVITAFVEDNLIPIELKDKKVEMSTLNLLIQPFTAETIFDGEFVLPANMFTVNINTNAVGKYMEPIYNSNLEWYLDDGEYNVSWKVPDSIPLENVTWTQLQIANTDKNSHTIQIWNIKTHAFEEVTDSRFTVTANINDYINQEGEVQYQLQKKAVQGDPYTRLPELRMKGEVKK